MTLPHSIGVMSLAPDQKLFIYKNWQSSHCSITARWT